MTCIEYKKIVVKEYLIIYPIHTIFVTLKILYLSKNYLIKYYQYK